MTKKIKLLTSLLILAFTLVFSSCGNNSTVNSTDSINEDVETKQKYVIELNMDNYKKYIDLRTEPAGDYCRYCFYGSLSYAYYDNVVITYYAGSETNTYTLVLSSGGYALFYSTGRYTTTYTVSNITGKVIYWI